MTLIFFFFRIMISNGKKSSKNFYKLVKQLFACLVKFFENVVQLKLYNFHILHKFKFKLSSLDGSLHLKVLLTKNIIVRERNFKISPLDISPHLKVMNFNLFS